MSICVTLCILPAEGTSQGEVYPVFCWPAHTHTLGYDYREQGSNFAPRAASSFSKLLPDHVTIISFHPMLSEFSEVLCWCMSPICSPSAVLFLPPSTLLKWVNYNSSGNNHPTRQQRSVWHLKPFLKAVLLFFLFFFCLFRAIPTAFGCSLSEARD